MKGINFNTILLIGVTVLLTMQLRSCFDKVHKPESMIRNEVELEHLKKDIVRDSIYYTGIINVLSDSIQSVKSKDNVFVNKLQTNDKKIKASNDRVSSLTDAELESGFANYPD